MMISDLITENLELWASAVRAKSTAGRGSNSRQEAYGINKLRELILELAVRGNLVPQNSNDESASILLKKIQSEHAKIIEEKGIRKPKASPSIAKDEAMFILPLGWEYVRNGNLFSLRKGKVPKSITDDGIGLPYLDIEALDRGNVLRFTDDEGCPQSTEEDILVVCDGSRSGLVLDGKDGVVGSTLAVIDTPKMIQPFVRLLFMQAFQKLNSSMKGAAIPHLDIKRLMLEIVGLPPLTEQQRIIAKVSELMALCDQLEQQQTHNAKTHQALVETLLGTLTRANSSQELAEAWAYIATQFETLFTTEHSIDQLKQNILQLAVMGKLVPQDPNDESASVLLEKISEKRKQLARKGQIKKPKKLPKIGDEEKPFNLPQNWEYVRLSELGEWGAGATPLRSRHDYYGGDIPWFKSGELVSDYISISEELVTNLALKETSLRYNQPGDVLIAMYGATIGKVSILKVAATTNQAVCACSPFEGFINTYLLTLLKAYRDRFISQGAGGAQPNISREKIIATVVGLPPTAEQIRIVDKVDKLMALCDALRAHIAQAQVTQAHYADAAVEKAIG